MASIFNSNEDLDTPGVTGLAKKHERLILFFAALIGVFGVYLAYKQSQSASSDVLSPSSGGGGGGSGTGSTSVTGSGTTGTSSTTPASDAFGITSTVDNGINYIKTKTSTSSGSLGLGLPGILTLGGSGGTSSGSGVNITAANSSTVTAEGDDSDLTALTNELTLTQGTYAQRATQQNQLLQEAEKSL